MREVLINRTGYMIDENRKQGQSTKHVDACIAKLWHYFRGFIRHFACLPFVFVCKSAALIAAYIAGNSGRTRLVPINFRSSG